MRNEQRFCPPAALSTISDHEKTGHRHWYVPDESDCRGARRHCAGGERAWQRLDFSSGAAHYFSHGMKQKLLIVDDDAAIRTQMKWALSNDYEIALAEDRISALSTFKTERPAVTLLDLGLPPRPNSPEEGLATLSEILSAEPQAKVIIISGQGDKKNALEAVGAGAYDFLCKPVDLDELTLIRKRCFYVVELEREYRE